MIGDTNGLRLLGISIGDEGLEQERKDIWSGLLDLDRPVVKRG